MNLHAFYAFIISITFIIGIFICGIYNKWIIIQFPTHTYYDTHTESVVCKKQISLHYYHHDKWNSETQERLWTDNTTDNVMELINAWLMLLDEERIIGKKTVLQSVLMSQAGTAYLSFDHNIFGKEDSIFKKWMMVEGLLKTLKENDISIHNVQFLIQHQPFNDLHLDLSMPWQLHGFMK